jgi:hypothetical protein
MKKDILTHKDFINKHYYYFEYYNYQYYIQFDRYIDLECCDCYVYLGKDIENQDFSYLSSGVYIISASNSEEIAQYKLIKQ